MTDKWLAGAGGGGGGGKAAAVAVDLLTLRKIILIQLR